LSLLTGVNVQVRGADMMDLEFRLVVEGFDVDDERQVAALHENCDATAASICGVTTITLTAAADEDRLATARCAISRLEGCTGARAVDLDLDLVDAGEIAERTGLSRQAVNLLATGKRGQRFPVPYALPGGHRVWTWAAVNVWLAEYRAQLADPVQHLTRTEQRQLAAWLASRDSADAAELLSVASN
jgi:predicted DNA-binding transcriptional regulator AlpA